MTTQSSAANVTADAAPRFECHAHIMANGVSYASALKLHRDEPNEAAVRAALAVYRDCGVTFVRDGGDKLGVSRLAKSLAPEYGIDYRTPIFILHRKGFYGSMYGFGYSDLSEARQLVAQAKRDGADFIKIAVTGMLDFAEAGKIVGAGADSGEPLPRDEVAELVNIANGEGFAVMAHCNGAESIKNALLAGIASVEHGFFMDDDGLALLRETGAVWVPTAVTVANNLDGSRFPGDVMRGILDGHADALKRAAALSRESHAQPIYIAAGSDAGAYNVPHGRGALDEAALLAAFGVDVSAGNARVERVFKRG